MIGALILAAGHSRRYGKPKLSEPLSNGLTLIEEVLGRTNGIFDSRLVITRRALKNLIPTLDQYRVAYRCMDESAGLGDSISFGVKQIALGFHEEWDACVICLADMPFIQRNTYQSIYNALSSGETNSALVAPYISEVDNIRGDDISALTIKRGHPVGFGSHYFHALCQLAGDIGAQRILKTNNEKLSLIAVEDPGILMDIDVPTDLEDLQS